MHQITKCK